MLFRMDEKIVMLIAIVVPGLIVSVLLVTKLAKGVKKK